ncbi:unnamed protein product, partial [Ectocarpus sp. 12 AP-2014]
RNRHQLHCTHRLRALASKERSHRRVHAVPFPWAACPMYPTQSRRLVGEMEEIESMIVEARQSLLQGPAACDLQREKRDIMISERLPRTVERLQRQPMTPQVAARCAKTFTVVQDFVDTCLRSPLLGEGDRARDLRPLLQTLRLLFSAAPATTAAEGRHHFNRDHGKPLLRQCHGRTRRFWPDDERGTWVGPDAIGWCIDVLDIPGELAQYQFSAPPLDDPAIEWTASAADANMWHRV